MLEQAAGLYISHRERKIGRDYVDSLLSDLQTFVDQNKRLPSRTKAQSGIEMLLACRLQKFRETYNKKGIDLTDEQRSDFESVGFQLVSHVGKKKEFFGSQLREYLAFVEINGRRPRAKRGDIYEKKLAKWADNLRTRFHSQSHTGKFGENVVAAVRAGLWDDLSEDNLVNDVNPKVEVSGRGLKTGYYHQGIVAEDTMLCKNRGGQQCTVGSCLENFVDANSGLPGVSKDNPCYRCKQGKNVRSDYSEE
jgi:hypothetical protein